MTDQERRHLPGSPTKVVRVHEQARKPDEVAIGAVGPPNSREHLCGSCLGVVTVVFGGPDRPEIGFRLGSKGRRHIRLHDEGGGDAAPGPLRREDSCARQKRVSGFRKISVVCGACSAALFRFDGGIND